MNELLELVGNLQDCPWSKWRPATLKLCEAQQCSWIVAPAEFWSNIGYLLVAFYLLWKGIQEVRSQKNGLRSIPLRFGFYALIVGICSALFHASRTYVFESFDLAAMFFLAIELMIQNLSRLGWLRSKSPLPLAGILFLGPLFLLLGLEGTARLFIFGGMVAITLWFEVLIYVRARRLKIMIPYGPLQQSLVLFGISYAFWIVDYTGLVCRPDVHFVSGHALWHIANAGCFLTLSRFYSGLKA